MKKWLLFLFLIGSFQINDLVCAAKSPPEIDNKEQKINTEKKSTDKHMDIMRKGYEMGELGQIGKLKDLTKIIDSIKNNQLFKDYSKQIFDAYEKNDTEKFNERLNIMKEIFPTNKLFLVLKDLNGNTLLHEAIRKKDYVVIDSVFNFNIDIFSDLIKITNKDGRTPVDFAADDRVLVDYVVNFSQRRKSELESQQEKIYDKLFMSLFPSMYSLKLDFSAKK